MMTLPPLTRRAIHDVVRRRESDEMDKTRARADETRPLARESLEALDTVLRPESEDVLMRVGRGDRAGDGAGVDATEEGLEARHSAASVAAGEGRLLGRREKKMRGEEEFLLLLLEPPDASTHGCGSNTRSYTASQPGIEYWLRDVCHLEEK